MQYGIRHLGDMMKNGSCILKDFKACMHNFEDELEFHDAWAALLHRYKMENNP